MQPKVLTDSINLINSFKIDKNKPCSNKNHNWQNLINKLYKYGNNNTKNHASIGQHIENKILTGLYTGPLTTDIKRSLRKDIKIKKFFLNLNIEKLLLEKPKVNDKLKYFFNNSDDITIKTHRDQIETYINKTFSATGVDKSFCFLSYVLENGIPIMEEDQSIIQQSSTTIATEQKEEETLPFKPFAIEGFRIDKNTRNSTKNRNWKNFIDETYESKNGASKIWNLIENQLLIGLNPDIKKQSKYYYNNSYITSNGKLLLRGDDKTREFVSNLNIEKLLLEKPKVNDKLKYFFNKSENITIKTYRDQIETYINKTFSATKGGESFCFLDYLLENGISLNQEKKQLEQQEQQITPSTSTIDININSRKRTIDKVDITDGSSNIIQQLSTTIETEQKEEETLPFKPFAIEDFQIDENTRNSTKNRNWKNFIDETYESKNGASKIWNLIENQLLIGLNPDIKKQSKYYYNNSYITSNGKLLLRGDDKTREFVSNLNIEKLLLEKPKVNDKLKYFFNKSENITIKTYRDQIETYINKTFPATKGGESFCFLDYLLENGISLNQEKKQLEQQEQQITPSTSTIDININSRKRTIDKVDITDGSSNIIQQLSTTIETEQKKKKTLSFTPYSISLHNKIPEPSSPWVQLITGIINQEQKLKEKESRKIDQKSEKTDQKLKKTVEELGYEELGYEKLKKIVEELGYEELKKIAEELEKDDIDVDIIADTILIALNPKIKEESNDYYQSGNLTTDERTLLQKTNLTTKDFLFRLDILNLSSKAIDALTSLFNGNNHTTITKYKKAIQSEMSKTEGDQQFCLMTSILKEEKKFWNHQKYPLQSTNTSSPNELLDSVVVQQAEQRANQNSTIWRPYL